jgi:integrase
VEERRSRNGVIVYTLHLRIDGRRPRVTLGAAREGWTRAAADEKLRDTLGALRAGVALEVLFPSEDAADVGRGSEPTLGEVMDDYLADRLGSVGERTLEGDRWAIGHLRDFWASRTPSQITPQLVDRFRRQKVAEATGLRERIAAGDSPTETRTYRRRSDGAVVTAVQARKPLAASSINALIQMLATLLEVAMERPDVELRANAARGSRRKVKVSQPTERSFLEVDQVWALLDAATMREHDAAAFTKHPYPARALISTLTLGGLRISEECTLRRGRVNLGVGVVKIGRSKTEAGYREVDVIFAALHQDLGDHLARPTPFTAADDPLFPSATGQPLSTNSVRQRVVNKSVVLANTLLRERGIPEIGHCTPHTLRRTYISLLLAAGCDPAYVMAQVGHTDPTLTLRIYQQLLKRRRREEYREQVNELLGTSPAATGSAHFGPNSGPNSPLVPGGPSALG